MRAPILLLLIAPLVLLGGDEKKKAPAKPAAKTAKPAAGAAQETTRPRPNDAEPQRAKRAEAAAQAAEIPAGAKQIETNVYRYTDPDGKTWILNKTPFGIMKTEEKLAKTEDDLPPGMTVVEDGDILRFERPTMFGPVRWTRKKTELTEMEQKAWERELRERAAKAPKE